MGRPEKSLDADEIFDLISRGVNKKDAAQELGVSIPTLSKRIADITEKQGVLLKYREIQNLQLTELQARVLEAITPEKIQGASLTELVTAFKVLKDKELVSLGKANNITGLVGYLVELEKRELSGNGSVIDITNLHTEENEALMAEVKDLANSDYIPEL